MKIQTILALGMTAGALCAQVPDQALDARIQLFAEMSHPASITVYNTNLQIQDQPKTQTGLGIRFMGELASSPNWYYELGGKLESSSKFTYNGSIGGANTMDLRNVKFTSSYWSLGGAYMIRPREIFTLGVHLEARGEALNAQGTVVENLVGAGSSNLTVVSTSATYVRPWVRVSFDVTVPMFGLRPYLGVDASAALTRTEQTTFLSLDLMDNRTLQSMAPRVTAAFYMGARF